MGIAKYFTILGELESFGRKNEEKDRRERRFAEGRDKATGAK